VYTELVFCLISYASWTFSLNVYEATFLTLLEGTFELLKGELCTLDSQLKQGWIINL